MKFLTHVFLHLILPLFLWGRIEVGKVALDLCLSTDPFYKTRIAAAYDLDEECYLVLRHVFSLKEGDQVLRKLEKRVDNLQFSSVKMVSGKTLEIGIFLDPFLFSWVIIGRVHGYKRKHLVSLLFFREDRAQMDYFSFMERLKILAV